MKLLPNINKSVPEAADPALIKPVSDAIEALDTALGAKPSTLTTTAKTLVGAINEVVGHSSGIIAPMPGYTMRSNYALRKTSNGIIYLQCVVDINSGYFSTTFTQVGTIPVGYRPALSVAGPVAGNGGQTGRYDINPSGVFSIEMAATQTSATFVGFSVFYIAA